MKAAVVVVALFYFLIKRSSPLWNPTEKRESLKLNLWPRGGLLSFLARFALRPRARERKKGGNKKRGGQNLTMRPTVADQHHLSTFCPPPLLLHFSYKVS